MAYTDLTNDKELVDTGNDSIVIVRNLESIQGGRSLNVAGFPLSVIRAGHVIIKETSTGDFKPMPINVTGSVATLGAITPGSEYVNDGTYTGVNLTGGSGSGAQATIVVAEGEVASVVITTPGTGYVKGDVLSAAAANIGTGGSGFAVEVATVLELAVSYKSLPAGHTYEGILIASIPAKKAFAGIMVRGTVNPNASPVPLAPILSAVKAALPVVLFRAD